MTCDGAVSVMLYTAFPSHFLFILSFLRQARSQGEKIWAFRTFVYKLPNFNSNKIKGFQIQTPEILQFRRPHETSVTAPVTFPPPLLLFRTARRLFSSTGS